MYALNIKDMTNNTCMCRNYIFTQRKTISRIKTFFPLCDIIYMTIKVKLALCLPGLWFWTVYQRAVSTEVMCLSSERSDQRSHPPLALLPAFSQIMWCSTSSSQSHIPEQQEAVSVVTLDLHTAHNRSQLWVKGVWRNIWPSDEEEQVNVLTSDASCWCTWENKRLVGYYTEYFHS